MGSIDCIDCVIDCGVHDSEAARPMNRGRLRARNADYAQKVPVPLDDRVDRIARGLSGAISLGRIRRGRQSGETGAKRDCKKSSQHG
jgi:hypothetical protein